MLDELTAMATYALGLGVRMPDSVVNVVMQVQGGGAAPLDRATLVAAENAHEALSRLLAPATPQAIALLDAEAHRKRRFPALPSFGPVPLVRQLTIAGLIFLVAFILLGLSSKVGRESGGILDSSGSELLLNLLFVLCAAGLGGVFAALFKVSRFIAARTYDPVYESSYWVNIVLGLIGGLLLAELILEALDSPGADQPSGIPFARPLLALIGGFSAKVVFQILNRLVEAVASVFKGDTDALVAANTEAARARLAVQQAEERIKLSTKLVQLQQSLNTGASTDEIAASVGGLLDELMPFDVAPAPLLAVAANGAGSADRDQPADPPATGDPSPDPTGDPTGDPTADPSPDPTGDPSGDPTGDPSADPTGDPTADPTGDPSGDPSADPTRDPTAG